jgi:hypothetical protein
MAELIYTPNTASITKFLKHIPNAGVPDKVTTRYLESVGFRAKNDRYLIGVLRAIGFIDGSQVPTDRWKQYRDKSKSKRVLGEAVKSTYADLFKTYPDAYQRDPDAIRNFFSSKSNVADSTLRLAVGAFKALAAESTFDGITPAADPGDSGGDGGDIGGSPQSRAKDRDADVERRGAGLHRQGHDGRAGRSCLRIDGEAPLWQGVTAVASVPSST